METVGFVLCLQRPPAAPLTKHNLQSSFSITTMDQFDHNAGLQGAPRELPMCVPENPSSLGFSSPGVPVANMYQENWCTNEAPAPSLEPINEGSGMSPASTQYMADFSHVRQLHSIRIRGRCFQRHAKPQTSRPFWHRWALEVRSPHRKACVSPLTLLSISTRLVI